MNNNTSPSQISIESARNLLKRPIAFHPINSKITGSVAAGLLLSQIWYWWNVMGCQEFYKKDEDFIQETTLGPKEFRNAKVRLVQMGILTAKAKGVPPRTHYYLNESVYFKLISKFADTGQINFAERDKLNFAEKDKSILPKQIKQNSPNDKNILYRTENTAENTPPIKAPQGASVFGDKISEAISSAKKENLPTPFEIFWNNYPRKIGKQQAEQQFDKNLKKHTAEAMLENATIYSEYCKQAKVQTQYIKTPAAFLKDYWNDEGAIKEWKAAISKADTKKVPYKAMPSNAKEKLLKLLDEEQLFDDQGGPLTRNSGIIREYLQTGYWNGLPKAVQEAIVNDQDDFIKIEKPQVPEPNDWREFLQSNYKVTPRIQSLLDGGWKAVPGWLKKEITDNLQLSTSKL